MLCALIMAGGKGERFWPLSTEDKPKQFLNLLGNDTMIQMTVKRIERFIPIERIFVVTGKKYTSLVKEQLPTLPVRNIIVEPVGKNTAPCIALSAFHIHKQFKDATIAVLPSDHLIGDEDKFREVLITANYFVDNNEDAIVTLGMKPDRPETGYGYIKYEKTDYILNGQEIRKVQQFVEKPNLETAVKYLNEGSYLWNGGMFVWKANTILKLTERFLSKSYNLLKEVMEADEELYEKILYKNYPKVESVSVDYGIMEYAENIYVIPTSFQWDDVGNWTSIGRYKEKDESGNVVNNSAYYHESSGNIVLTNKKILLNNVQDLIVVETDECIIISSKNSEQKIKQAKKLVI